MAELIGTIVELRKLLASHCSAGRSVGLVPTMGYLHAGHASLMAAATSHNDVTVTSIFVNPLQFAADEDLETYPRDPDHDLSVCRDEGVDIVFAPDQAEMYPRPIDTVVTVADVAAPLEGMARPGHFAGVATVVAKLFSIVGPCRAYFGAKDWQQLMVVRRMAADLSMPVEVVACPIIREPDGLALSSRNIYLNADERRQAPVLRRALEIGTRWVEGGESDPAVVEAAMVAEISGASLAMLDYAAVVPAATLVNEGPLSGELRLLLAVRFGRTRLIDNAGLVVGP